MRWRSLLHPIVTFVQTMCPQSVCKEDVHRPHYIRRVSAGGDGEGEIIGAAQALTLTRENPAEELMIADWTSALVPYQLSHHIVTVITMCTRQERDNYASLQSWTTTSV